MKGHQGRSRTYYFARYRKHLGRECERCGSEINLIVHHKDDDFTNNEKENLETLCRRCHQVHHKCWEQLPKEKRPITIEVRICSFCKGKYERKKGYPATKFCSRRCAMLKRHQEGKRDVKK